MSRRRPEPIAANEEAWIWGNHRGGGGAPLKDNDGNHVANLKKVINGSQDVDHSPSPVGKNRQNSRFRQEDDYDDDDNYNNKYSSSNKNNYRQDDHRQDDRRQDDRRQDDRRRPQEEYGVSPKKVGGHGSFTNINNHIPDHEKEAKKRKELEYQAALKKQIDEKNRIKNLEKDQLEREKAREHREFMNQIKGKVPSHDNSPRGGNRNDRNDYRDNDDHHEQSSNRNRNKFRAEDDSVSGNDKFRKPEPVSQQGNNGSRPRANRNYSDDEEQQDLSARNYNKKFVHSSPNKKGVVDYEIHSRDDYGGNRAGQNKKSIRKSIDFVDEPDYDDQDSVGGGRGGGRVPKLPPRGGKGGKEKDFVPVQEYDELSKLCDQLMGQQDQLQLELKQQAKLIEDLQKGRGGGVASRGAVPKLGVPSKQQQVNKALGNLSPRGNAALNVNRSKSVQQARPGALPGRRGAADDNDSASRALAMKRPSSMHTITNRDKVAAAAGPPVVKRAAFGSASEKPPAYIKKEEVKAPKKPKNLKLEHVFPNKSNIPVANRYTADSNKKSEGAPISKAPALNGFAKLQLGVSGVRGGPVVVTYDDEETGAGGRGGRGGHGRDSGGGELQGRSEYIRVNDDDEVVNGDQLDRLLNKAKRANVRY